MDKMYIKLKCALIHSPTEPQTLGAHSFNHFQHIANIHFQIKISIACQ